MRAHQMTGVTLNDAGNMVIIPPNQSASVPIEAYSTPIAVFPRRTNRRTLIQRSMFMLFGGKLVQAKNTPFRYTKKQDGTYPSLPEPTFAFAADLVKNNAKAPKRYLKIKVPKDAKRDILQELFWLGIDAETLFPELEYQVASLRSRFTERDPERANRYSRPSPIV